MSEIEGKKKGNGLLQKPVAVGAMGVGMVTGAITGAVSAVNFALRDVYEKQVTYQGNRVLIIGSVVQLMTSSGREARMAAVFKEKMEGVMQFMSSNGVSSSLRKKIFWFYRSIWLWHTEEVQMWESCYSDLVPSLREELMAELLGDTISQFPPFASMEAEELSIIAGFLSPNLLTQEEDVCVQGEEATMVHILKEGAVEEIKDYHSTGKIFIAPALLTLDALESLEGPHTPPTYHNMLRTIRPSTLFALDVAKMDNKMKSMGDREEKEMRAKLQNLVSKYARTGPVKWASMKPHHTPSVQINQGPGACVNQVLPVTDEDAVSSPPQVTPAKEGAHLSNS